MPAVAREVQTAKGPVHVDEHPGAGPAVVVTHEIPDDSRIYDRLVPELEGRHVVAFDFHGHGRSGRESAWPLAPGQHEGELAAVIDALGLERPILVGHDVGGPVVIDYALGAPDRVGGLVLLNTFFGSSPTLLLFINRRLNPEAVGAEGVAELAILPQFFGSAEQPDAVAAIRAWTAELPEALAAQDAQIAGGALARLEVPVRIAFGENDPYFNGGVAEHLHGLFPQAELHGIAGAAHWPQWDQPAATAAVIATL